MRMRGAVLYPQGMAPEIDGGECSIGAICVLRGGSGKAASGRLYMVQGHVRIGSIRVPVLGSLCIVGLCAHGSEGGRPASAGKRSRHIYKVAPLLTI